MHIIPFYNKRQAQMIQRDCYKIVFEVIKLKCLFSNKRLWFLFVWIFWGGRGDIGYLY